MITTKHPLFVFVSVVIVDLCFGGAHLFACGPEDGDKEFPTGDDTSHLFNLATPFRFFGMNLKSIYFGSNGILSTVPYTDFTPNGDIGDPTKYPDPIMAVFHDDLNDARDLGAYARDTTNVVDLSIATDYVLELFPSTLDGFAATHLTIFTWNMFSVYSPPSGTDPVMTMQAVLVRSAVASVVLYLYDSLSLFKRDFPVIGVTKGNGINHKSLCVSNTADAATLDTAGQGPTTCGLYGFIVDGDSVLADATCVSSQATGGCPGFMVSLVSLMITTPSEAHDVCLATEPLSLVLQDLVTINKNCEGCIVSNGLGFNPFVGDCTCYWTCVLKRSVKVKSTPANNWVAYKRCCPCGLVWSQHLLTCVDYRSKSSDCWRGNPQFYFNPCEDLPAGTYLERQNPDKAAQMCAGYMRCVKVGDRSMPKAECCPDGQCFDKTKTDDVPCSTGACSVVPGCTGADDCACDRDPEPESECQYQSVPGDVNQFMGRENMITFTCAAGTCWDDSLCACVRTNNTGYNDCIPWVEMDFDENSIKAKSGRGDFMWSESSGVTVHANGPDGTGFYARFDGDNDYINLAALAHADIGNTFVMRFFFRPENNIAPPAEEYIQEMFSHCFGAQISELALPSIVTVIGRDVSGDGINMAIIFAYNSGDFRLDATPNMIDISGVLTVGVWYEYWFVYLGEEGVAYLAVLDNVGAVVTAGGTSLEDSKGILISPSGFVFGNATIPNVLDFDGCMDEIRLHRCKPVGDADFDAGFAAILDFL